MSKLFWNALRVSPAALGATLLVSQGVVAAETTLSDADLASDAEVAEAVLGATEALEADAPEFAVEAPLELAELPASVEDAGLADEVLSLDELASDPAAMDQVTSVSQLSDVQPTDWAFQALQSLVERYGCIAGYPDGTYRGNQALTRYEFAAGLNACLDRINELIAASTANLATKEDLQVLQRLQEEFAAELATLRGRVDALEARASELEANQFSTTTKLNGEALMTLAAVNELDDGDFDDDENGEAIFANRLRLNFDTSFTGRDRLRTRLQAGNIGRFYRNTTSMLRLGHEAGGGNDITLDVLYYRFPISSTLTGHVGTAGLANDDIHSTLNPYLDSSGGGSISRFGQRNPVFRTPDGAGIGLDYEGDRLFGAISYLASEAGDPLEGNGVFNGSHNAAASLGYRIIDNSEDDGFVWDLGLFYTHAYFSQGDDGYTGGTGSGLGNDPFGGAPGTSDSVGIQTNLSFSPRFNLGGWFGYSWADAKRGNADAELLNWALTFAFPDLFKEGSLGGILVGQPPHITDSDGIVDDDDDPAWHIEAFYRFQMNDHISITPGVFVVTNANHDDDSETAVVGVLRTQFRF